MVKPIGWFESRSWWPLALSAAVLVVAVAFDPRGAYPSVALTLVAQLVFLTLSSAAVVALVGRAFLAEGSVSLLLLACGAVFLGLGGVIATAAAPGAVNVVITIHNLCAWCSAACHFVGILLAQRRRIDRARSAALGGAILAALTLIGVCVAAASLSHPTCTEGVGSLGAALAQASGPREHWVKRVQIYEPVIGLAIHCREPKAYQPLGFALQIHDDNSRCDFLKGHQAMAHAQNARQIAVVVGATWSPSGWASMTSSASAKSDSVKACTRLKL